MRIILANPRGFCAGVNMAIESLERALELFGTPLYVYHEIVHNRPIVERFRARGVVFVDDISEVPAGGTVLYSAHGVAPEIRRQSAARNLRAIDATCPLVTKVHMEAVRFARDGYTIVLIGHEGHDEVLGTMGEAPQHMALVEDTGFDAFDAGTLAESWRQQPGAPCYCTDLTREEMPAALAAAERARLPKRRDLSVAAIFERVGDGVKNPDAEYAVRLNRALFT